mgnify:CR=1 FL=1
MKRSLINTAILGALGLGAVFQVSAQAVETAEISLCAGQFTIPANTAGLNNPEDIVMWGYALGEGNANGCVNTPTSPGPSILLPNNTEDSPTVYNLQIKLYNALPRSTSLVIPGLVKPMSPAFFTAPDGTTRVHSFDTEVTPGNNVTYQWAGVTQGAYLYQSGTHQQIQVQMGLVGAIMSDAFTGNTTRAAYPNLTYDALYPMIYSEIDPVIHAGVALGDYSTADMKSTIDYAPKYFGLTLDTLNTASCSGDPFCTQGDRLSTFEGEAVNLSLANGEKPIFRMFNGSTRIHTPTLIGGNFDVIAEDGKLYPNLRRLVAVDLPPLKTKDAVLDTSGFGDAGGTIRLTDSAMNLSNPAPDATGTVAALAESKVIASGDDTVHAELHVKPSANYVAPVFTAGVTPIARRDQVSVGEGLSTSINVLANDENYTDATLGVVTQPRHGTLTQTANGFDYQHDASEGSRDSFIYSLVKAGQPSATAGVVISVNQQNDDPIAVDDSATLKVGQQVEVRVLDNDTDADSRSLKIVAVDASGYTVGSVSFVDKAVTLSGDQVGGGVVGYTISDGQGGSASASINVTVAAADNGGGDQYTNGDDGNGSDDSVTTGASPIAKDDSFAVAEGGIYDITGDPANGIQPNLILGVLSNDVANGGKVSMDEYPEHGAIDMHEDGTFKYIHDGSEENEDRFSYSVFNTWGSDKAEVKVFVTAKMDAPRVNDDRAKVKMNQAEVIDILDNDKDRDSEIRNARVEIVEAPASGTLTIGADNKVTYTPNAGFTGNDSFKYRLYDDITHEASRRDARVKIRVK